MGNDWRPVCIVLKEQLPDPKIIPEGPMGILRGPVVELSHKAQRLCCAGGAIFVTPSYQSMNAVNKFLWAEDIS